MNARFVSRALLLLAVFVAGAGFVLPPDVSANATITIVNTDGPGEGFNDATPVAPIGGNPGTTLGQQRLIAFQFAADIWALALDSNVEIRIQATFDPLSCNATSAVLGSAGATFVFANFPGSGGTFPGAGYPETWYSSALADKRAGVELNAVPGTPDLRARFNVNLGLPGCLTGIGWYYGLDGNHGTQIDLVAVLLHEFGHGLGNQQFASLTTGANFSGRTDVYARNMYDKTIGKTWDAMTNAERAASAVNSRRVIWQGPAVSAAVPQVLEPGTPLLTVTAPPSLAGLVAIGSAAFGPPLSSPGVTGSVVQATDGVGATNDGCEPLTNGAAVAGNIAIIDRGTCTFVVKVKNAQDAGAIGVIIADNAPGSPPAGLGGVDPTITIPSGRVTQGDGNAIKAALPGVTVTLGVNMAVLAGADENGKALLFAPNPVQGGSSISHWDPIAFRNLLMEPFNTPNQPHSLVPPDDITLATMRDIGWFADPDLDGVASEIDCEPNSDFSPTIVIEGCDSGVPNPFSTDGCTLADQLAHIAASARNHGAFVSGVAHYTNNLRRMGSMTDEQRNAIIECAAHSGVGHGQQIMLEDQSAGASRFGLRFAGSNPARGGTSVELSLPARGPASVRVFDVRGALVRELASGEFAAGSHLVQWDGRDASGSPAEAGVYFVHAASRDAVTSLRFVMIK